MSPDLKEYLERLKLVAYTLADGSKVVGEERMYNLDQGTTSVYGVLEFNQCNDNSPLYAYVPDVLDGIFTFNDKHIISRVNATFELRVLYYESLIRLRLEQVMSPEEFKHFLMESNPCTTSHKPASPTSKLMFDKHLSRN